MDPLVEKTMDAYGYCYNNPINLVDPTGMYADGWIEDDVTGEVCWDDNATSQETTPQGYTYKGEQYEKVVGGMQMLYESNGTSINAGIALSQVTITTPDPWRGTYFDRRNYGKGKNPFSPYIPDGYGITLGVSGRVMGVPFGKSFTAAMNNRHDVGIIENFNVPMGTSLMFNNLFDLDFDASFNIYDNFGDEKDIFSGLQGTAKGVSAAYIYGGEYSASTNALGNYTESGTQAFSINFIPMIGADYNETHSTLIWSSKK